MGRPPAQTLGGPSPSPPLSVRSCAWLGHYATTIALEAAEPMEIYIFTASWDYWAKSFKLGDEILPVIALDQDLNEFNFQQ